MPVASLFVFRMNNKTLNPSHSFDIVFFDLPTCHTIIRSALDEAGRYPVAILSLCRRSILRSAIRQPLNSE